MGRFGRFGWVMAIAAACAACAPKTSLRDAPSSIAIIPDDHQLLRQLALADPLDQPAQPAWPMHPGEKIQDVAAPRFVAPPFSAPTVDQPDGSRAADCLTAAVYYEARSEPLDGQRAVAQVVLNRVRDRAFPASVCKVVYQRSSRGCQFSFACDGSTARRIEPQAWAVARDVAMAALNGSVYAPVGAATHYHTTAILPWWASSLTRIGVVGSHLFYRWRDGLANALSFRQAYSGVELDARAATTVAYNGPMGGAVGGLNAGAPTAALAPVAQSFRQGGVIVHHADMMPHDAPLALHAATMTMVGGVRVHHGDAGGAGEAPAAGAPVAVSAPAPAATGEGAGLSVN